MMKRTDVTEVTPYTAEVLASLRSGISAMVAAFSVIATTPARCDVFGTESGIVSLKGRSVAERAKAVISIAHPDFAKIWSGSPTKTD